MNIIHSVRNWLTTKQSLIAGLRTIQNASHYVVSVNPDQDLGRNCTNSEVYRLFNHGKMMQEQNQIGSVADFGEAVSARRSFSGCEQAGNPVKAMIEWKWPENMDFLRKVAIRVPELQRLCTCTQRLFSTNKNAMVRITLKIHFLLTLNRVFFSGFFVVVVVGTCFSWILLVLMLFKINEIDYMITFNTTRHLIPIDTSTFTITFARIYCESFRQFP